MSYVLTVQLDSIYLASSVWIAIQRVNIVWAHKQMSALTVIMEHTCTQVPVWQFALLSTTQMTQI